MKNSRRKAIKSKQHYSMLVERAQLVSFRGLFEFDDVIHNALGTAIGILLVLGLRRMLRR